MKPGFPALVPILDAIFERDVVQRSASLGRASAFELSPPTFVFLATAISVPDDQSGGLQNRMNRQTSIVRTHRILIVDDDDVLRRWLRAQLDSRI